MGFHKFFTCMNSVGVLMLALKRIRMYMFECMYVCVQL